MPNPLVIGDYQRSALQPADVFSSSGTCCWWPPRIVLIVRRRDRLLRGRWARTIRQLRVGGKRMRGMRYFLRNHGYLCQGAFALHSSRTRAGSPRLTPKEIELVRFIRDGSFEWGSSRQQAPRECLGTARLPSVADWLTFCAHADRIGPGSGAHRADARAASPRGCSQLARYWQRRAPALCRGAARRGAKEMTVRGSVFAAELARFEASPVGRLARLGSRASGSARELASSSCPGSSGPFCSRFSSSSKAWCSDPDRRSFHRGARAVLVAVLCANIRSCGRKPRSCTPTWTRSSLRSSSATVLSSAAGP